jgi:hypothetical protein
MPKCQFLFSAAFGFRNPSKEILSELDEIDAQDLKIPRSFQTWAELQPGMAGQLPGLGFLRQARKQRVIRLN